MRQNTSKAKMYWLQSYEKTFFHSLSNFIQTSLALLHVVPFNWMFSLFVPGELLPTYSSRLSLITTFTVNGSSLTSSGPVTHFLCAPNCAFNMIFYHILLNANNVMIYLWIVLTIRLPIRLLASTVVPQHGSQWTSNSDVPVFVKFSHTVSLGWHVSDML